MMYLEHFGLLEQPFGVTPDPKFLYFSAEHAEALAALHYGLTERRGLLVLTAAPGAGKTTLLHYLVEHWKEKAQTAFVIRPPETRDQMMASVLEDLGLAPARDFAEGRRALQNLALECHAQGRRLLLVFDEAQTIPEAVLEEIRLLSNFETPEVKLIEIILAGQPELAAQLDSPRYEPLGQRALVRAHIGPLDKEEVRRCVEHRLRVAGREKRIFSRRALRLAAEASQGIPRKVNAVCFEALGSAFAAGRNRVGEPEIRSAAMAAGMALPLQNAGWPVAPVGWAAALAAIVLFAGAARFAGGASAIERALLRANWLPRGVSAAPPVERTPTVAVADATPEPTPAGAESSASEAGASVPAPSTDRPYASADPADSREASAPEATARSGGARPKEARAQPAAERVQVRRGQTLRSIALRTYGRWNPKVWDYIHQANPSLVSPDMLRAGQVLLLPPRPEAKAPP
jgi:general secretion pathway protein A